MTIKQYENYINGEWLAADNYTDNISPSDVSDVIGRYAQASEAQAQSAIAAANQAAAQWGQSAL